MWKKISSKILLKHPRITLREDIVQIPGKGQFPYVLIEPNGDGATIIAKKDNKILLQKEYSYPPNEVMYQFPGGHIPYGEKIEDGANRELTEESGYFAQKLEYLGWYYPSNRHSSQKMHVFLGTDLLEKPTNPDPYESIENFWFTEKKIDKMIRENKIVNYSLLAGWSLYKSKK